MAEAGVVRESSGVANSRCAVHPERQGVAVCDRCGDYHCADCDKRIAGRALCARCRKLPGVDYLEDARRRFWGKRDGFIWYFGALTPLMVLVALPSMIGKADFGHWVSTVMWLCFSFAYLAKLRLARALAIPLMLLDLCTDLLRVALGLPISPAAPASSPSAALGQALLGGLLGLLVAFTAYRSPRNRLAFELELDDEDLQRVYDRYLSNPMAVRGAVYSLLALLIPFASLITLVMSISAFRRANSEAWPPRGGRLPARLGIALSVLGALAWTLMVAAAIARRGH